MSTLLHIASVVVHHLPEAETALDAAIAELPAAEVAARATGRSVVLFEGAHEGELVARIEALRELRGVLGVSLVHHHAESPESLNEELDDDYTP